MRHHGSPHSHANIRPHRRRIWAIGDEVYATFQLNMVKAAVAPPSGEGTPWLAKHSVLLLETTLP